MSGFITFIKKRLFIFQGQVWANKEGFFRKFLKFMDFLIAFFNTNLLSVNLNEKKFLIDNRIVKKNKINVLGHGSIAGIDLSFNNNKISKIKKYEIIKSIFRINPPDNFYLFLYIGRLNRDKGVLNLLEAFKNIYKSNNNCYLLFIGPDEESLYSKLKGKNIKRLKYCSDPSIFYKIADCFILPSKREGMPVTILESFKFKTPVIASNIYGITSLVKDYKTGLLFPVNDKLILQKKMMEIYHNVKLSRELSRRAYDYVAKKFNQKYVVNLYVNYIDRLIDK